MNALAMMVGLLSCFAAAAPADVPVNRLLESVSQRAKVNFVMAADYSGKKVSADARGATLADALEALDGLGLGARQVGRSNTYLVAAKGSAALKPAATEGGPALDRIVNLRLKDARLEDVAAVLAKQTKAAFVLAESLRGRRITVFLRNLTAREALDVLAAVKGVSIRLLTRTPESYEIVPAP